MSEAPTRPAAVSGAPLTGDLRVAGEPLAQVERSVAAVLAANGIRSAAVDARWLVENIDGRDPLRHPAATFTGDGARLADLVRRRAARQPLQLILGTTSFMGHELRCAPGVFVPRPETEVLASLAIAAARRVVDRGQCPRVVEVCTGTGAVARALFEAVTPIELVAADIDPKAVALAGHNLAVAPAAHRDAPRSRRAKLGDRERPGLRGAGVVQVVRSDLLEQIDVGWRGTLDVLIANPPYLPAADLAELEPEVGDHDPIHALIGGPDGDEVVRRLVDDAVVWLRHGGALLVEIDSRGAEAAAAAAAAAGLTGIDIRDDLTGRPRVLVARRGEASSGEVAPVSAPAGVGGRKGHR